MKTVLNFNSLAIENLMLSLKTGFILAMVAGFMFITYLGMSKPEPLKNEKSQILVTNPASFDKTVANI